LHIIIIIRKKIDHDTVGPAEIQTVYLSITRRICDVPNRLPALTPTTVAKGFRGSRNSILD
jgi:hypothetical protein